MIPPGEVTGLALFWLEFGHAATVIVIFATAFVMIFFAWLWRSMKTFNTMTLHVDKIAKAHYDADGQPIRHMDHHLAVRDLLIEIKGVCTVCRERADEHYDDVERLTDDEHWKNCPVDKCPNLQSHITRVEAFQASAIEERNETNTEIRDLTAEIHSFVIEVIKSRRKRNGEE